MNQVRFTCFKPVVQQKICFKCESHMLNMVKVVKIINVIDVRNVIIHRLKSIVIKVIAQQLIQILNFLLKKAVVFGV